MLDYVSRPSYLRYPLLQRHRLSTTVDAKLVEQASDVELGGVLGDVQLAGDLFVGRPGCNHAKGFAFPRRERNFLPIRLMGGWKSRLKSCLMASSFFELESSRTRNRAQCTVQDNNAQKPRAYLEQPILLIHPRLCSSIAEPDFRLYGFLLPTFALP